MAMLTRGKRALKASLEAQTAKKLQKRMSPTVEAKYWSEIGLDKDGFERKWVSDDIGYGLFATIPFAPGSFLAEYVGERITFAEAAERDRRYAKKDSKKHPRCYIYYFKYGGKLQCIDGTNITDRVCRYANDAEESDITCNAHMKMKVFNNYPRLCLFAKRQINAGEEIRYDYGEDEETLVWRKKKRQSTEDCVDSEIDDNPFDLPQSELELDQELESELSSQRGYADIDISDPNDPSYKPTNSDMSEASHSTYSDIIPDTSDTMIPDAILRNFSFGSFLCQTENQDRVKEEENVCVDEHQTLAAKPCTKADSESKMADNGYLGVQENAGLSDLPKEADGDPDKIMESATGRPAGTYTDYTIPENVCLESHERVKQKDQPEEEKVCIDENQTLVAKPCTKANSESTVADDGYLGAQENAGFSDLQAEADGDPDKAINEEKTTHPGTKTTTTYSTCTSALTCTQCSKTFKKRGALTTHMQSHNKVKDKDYERPPRICPFCQPLSKHTQLPRHIAKKHSKLPEVAEALSLPQGSKERNECFERFRKDGIFKYNEMQSRSDKPTYMAERKTQKDIICCSTCKGFYGRRLFHRHKATCTPDRTSEPIGIHMDVFSSHGDNFSELVLSRFRQDAIGNLCRTDPTLILIGRRLFQKVNKKPNAVLDTKSNVMRDMRLVARLYQIVRENVECEGVEDIFLRKNFNALEMAIGRVTKEDNDTLKHGVKYHLYYLICTVHEILVAHYLSKDMDEKAAEIEKFKKLLDLNKTLIFGDAIYQINMKRQEKLRMPEQMADESDVKKLRQYICETISKYTSEYTIIGPHEYVKLRDSLCARVTLFNARRGGEPARLRLHQYDDIKSSRWVNSKQKQNVDVLDRELFKEMEVTYQTGKGNHLVSDFIPTECRKGLDILTDPHIRRTATVPECNDFVFASTQGSNFHVSGWDAIHRMCEGADVAQPNLLTATHQRHRISTLYSALDVPESERQYFYKHMGHSKEVNIGTYQYPMPVMAVTKVGRHLQAMDKALETASTSTSASSTSMDDIASPAQDTLSDSIQPSKNTEEEVTMNTLSEAAESDQNAIAEPLITGNHTGAVAKAGREYFKWTATETEQIKTDFRDWIEVADGNRLPSKQQLLEYIDIKPGRYNYKLLKTKIMNEQNKKQSTSKKRMDKFLEKQ